MNWTSYTTRKVILGGLASAAVLGAWFATARFIGAGQYYGTMVTGLCTLYATFCGANIAQDHVYTRNGVDTRDSAKTAPKAAAKPQPRPPVEPLPED